MRHEKESSYSTKSIVSAEIKVGETLTNFCQFFRGNKLVEIYCKRVNIGVKG